METPDFYQINIYWHMYMERFAIEKIFVKYTEFEIHMSRNSYGEVIIKTIHT
jgi:hypothetical protein